MDAFAMGVVVGLFFGAGAMIYSFAKGKVALALVSFGVTTLAGGIAGVIGAAPVCGLFVYLAAREKKHE